MKTKRINESCLSTPRRGSYFDCFKSVAGDCDTMPSVWFSDPSIGVIEEDSDTLSGGRLVDFKRAIDHVQARGVRVSLKASDIAASGSATLTFASTDQNNAFLGVEIAISGRIADLQSALLNITVPAGVFYPGNSTGRSSASRNVRVRVTQLSGGIFYIYIPFLKTIVAGVEDNQTVAAALGASAPTIEITGFSGDGLNVEATYVSANTSELLRMTAAADLALTDGLG